MLGRLFEFWWRNETAELKKFARDNELSYYPVRVLGPSSKTRKQFEEFIEEKAQKLLPVEQFSKEGPNRYREEECVEIGGVLGNNGTLYELIYTGENEIEVDEEYNYVLNIFLQYFPLDHIRAKTNTIVHWHTHPRTPSLSKQDVIHLNYILESTINNIRKDKGYKRLQYYSALYLPFNNQVLWYKYKETQKS